MDAEQDDLIAQSITLSEPQKELIRRMRDCERQLPESERIPRHERNLIMVRLAKTAPPYLTKSQIVELLRAQYHHLERVTAGNLRPFVDALREAFKTQTRSAERRAQ